MDHTHNTHRLSRIVPFLRAPLSLVQELLALVLILMHIMDQGLWTLLQLENLQLDFWTRSPLHLVEHTTYIFIFSHSISTIMARSSFSIVLTLLSMENLMCMKETTNGPKVKDILLRKEFQIAVGKSLKES